MFDRLGHVTFRHRRLVLALAGAFLALGALWGTGVFGSMVSSGFETRAASRPGRRRRPRPPSAAMAPTWSSSTATAAAPSTTRPSAARSRRTSPSLPHDLVASTTTTWTAGPDAAGSSRPTARRPTPSLQLTGDGDDELMDAYDAARAARCATRPPGLDVRLGGDAAISSDINNQVSEDIAPGRDDLDADPAGAARPHLRRPRRGQPAAGDRRAGDPRRLHALRLLTPGHRRLDLLGQHRHDARPRPGHRLRRCSSSAGSARSSAGGTDTEAALRPHDGHRRPHGRVLRPHRGHLAGRRC